MAMGPAELATLGRLNFAAERLTSQLHPVADAQDRNAEGEDCRVALGSAGLVDAGRTARKDQPPRLQFRHAGRREIVTHDLAEDVLLAHSPRNQLAVLRAEVEDQNAFTFALHVVLPTVPCQRIWRIT